MICTEQRFTELFHRGQSGDNFARGLAYTLIYKQLHRTAELLLHREHGGGRTLQPTALVGELFVRLHKLQSKVLNREHFLSLAARSMRQHLIDRGRQRSVRARSLPVLVASLTPLAHPATEEHAAVRQVWDRLYQHDPLAADIVWMLKVEGKTLNEVANQKKMPIWRVVAQSDYALEWMAAKLS